MTRALAVASWAALLAVLVLTLLSAGQPLFTDDLWWHLALGEAYAQQGPWLERDPLLFTAAGPPAPAAWLTDLALSSVERAFGLYGLRFLHVFWVAGILGLVWSLSRRAGASAWGATAATAVFAAMAAYRLIQLRPHLVTIGAALVLTRLVLEGGARPARSREIAAIVLMALWSNLHGGFLIGPALLFASALGWLAQAAASRGDLRPKAARRGLALGVTALLGLAATGLNPSGFARHGAFFRAGSDDTPALSLVLDEWSGVDPFAWPVPDLPPTPLTWLLFWGLCAATLWAALRVVRELRGTAPAAAAPRASGLVLAIGSLAAMLFAVRFTWLCVFPMLLILSVSGRRDAGPERVRRALSRAAAVALLPAFVLLGAWPMISRGISTYGFVERYRPPYPPDKYPLNAVWFMADAGLAGNLFNEYVDGGFLAFWLAPQLRGFVNGSLNVPADAMDASRAMREGRGQRPGETFLELLDRYQIDVFMGVGAPVLPRGSRPVRYSTALLEGKPGWLPLFRDPRSAVYLRKGERNRANLERVVAYYERERVPFDPTRGFEPGQAIETALPWAIERGLVPRRFSSLQASTRVPDPATRSRAWERLAQAYGMLGLYEYALRMDGRLLKLRPDDPGARKRIVWELLRLGRAAEALEASAGLESDPLGALLRATARALVDDPDDTVAASLVSRLPILTPAESALIAWRFALPEVRPSRR